MEAGWEAEPTLGDYLSILWRRRWIVIAAVVIIADLALAWSLLQDDRYRSSATVLARGSAAQEVVDAGSQNVQLRQRDLENELVRAESDAVRGAVEEAVPEGVGLSVRVESSSDTLVFTATAPEAELAAQSADLFAQSYVDARQNAATDAFLQSTAVVEEQLAALAGERVEAREELDNLESRLAGLELGSAAYAEVDAQRRRLEGQLGPQLAALDAEEAALTDTLARLQLNSDLVNANAATITQRAEVPDGAFAPATVRNTVLGVVLGLIVGVGAALVIESLDTRVRNREALTRLAGVPVLGGIPAERQIVEPARRVLDFADHPVTEAYRTLRASLEFASQDRARHSILVTSANPSEGKTSVACNLAAALADSGVRVALVDLDLRKPRVHRVFDMRREPGVSSVLLDDVEVESALTPVDADGQMLVMPSGAHLTNPSEVAASREIDKLLADLEAMFDIVVIDASPLLPVVDAQHLVRIVDGTVLVVNAGETGKSDVQTAVDTLERAGAELVGTVLIGDPSGGGRYGYGYYGSANEAERSGSRRLWRRGRSSSSSSKAAPRVPVKI